MCVLFAYVHHKKVYLPLPPEGKERHLRVDEGHIAVQLQFVDHVVQNCPRVVVVVVLVRLQPARVSVRVWNHNHLKQTTANILNN